MAEEGVDEFDPSKGDVPSFDAKREIDTHKTRYDSIGKKPSPEDLIRSYAEAEHPREDDDAEDDGYSDFPPGDIQFSEKELEAIREANEEAEEDPDEEDYAEALVEPFDPDDLEEIEGFGHIICPLHTARKSDVIYLIPEGYLGEIYNVESLTYYERDNVLCDISSVPVENVTQVIADALEHFGECMGEPETNDEMVYVRNVSLGVEYEITRVDGYYGAHLYGVSDEDFEGGGMSPLPRKATKRKNVSQEED